jgi:hypothetical protein
MVRSPIVELGVKTNLPIQFGGVYGLTGGGLHMNLNEVPF